MTNISCLVNTTWIGNVNEINIHYLTGEQRTHQWVVYITFVNMIDNILIAKLEFVDNKNSQNNGLEFCTFTIDEYKNIQGIDSNGIYNGKFSENYNNMELVFRGIEHMNNMSKIIKHFKTVFVRNN